MSNSSSRWKWLALAGVIAVGGVAAGRYVSHRGAAPAATPSVGAPRIDDTPLACVFAHGDEQAYTLKTSFDVSMDPSVLGFAGAPGGGIGIGVDVEGTLQLHALHADGDAFVVAMRLAEAKLTPRGAGAEVKTDALARPWLVRIGRDCAFRDVGYPSDIDPRAMRMEESLLQQVEVVLGQHPRDLKWRATQHDALGSYLAMYQRAAGRVRGVKRVRGAYTQIWPVARGAAMSGSQVAVVSSATDFTVDDQGRWLDDLSSSEDLKITTVAQVPVAEVHLATHLATTAVGATGLADVSEKGMTWRPSGSPPVDVTDEAPASDAGLVALPVDAVLARMREQLASNAPGSVAQASNLLRDVLRRNPGAAGTLYDDLFSGSIDNGLAPVVFLGLQKAGTREAQAVLVRAMNEGRMSVANRLRAVAALPDVPHPTPGTLDALKAASVTTGGSHDDASVRTSATYAIGTLERRARGKDAALATLAREDIRSKLGSRDHAQLAAALAAIGNSGDTDLLTDLRPHLTDSDVAVRRSAIEALASMPPSSDADAFATTFDAQSAPPLRGLVAEEFADQARLAGTPPPDPVVSTALARLGTEQDPSVRLQLIQLLGLATSTRPDARAALIAQLSKESDPRLESAIGQFIPAEDLP